MFTNIHLVIQLTDYDGNLPGDFALGLATDCKSGCNRLTSTPTEKRITLDLLDIR